MHTKILLRSLIMTFFFNYWFDLTADQTESTGSELQSELHGHHDTRYVLHLSQCSSIPDDAISRQKVVEKLSHYSWIERRQCHLIKTHNLYLTFSNKEVIQHYNQQRDLIVDGKYGGNCNFSTLSCVYVRFLTCCYV